MYDKGYLYFNQRFVLCEFILMETVTTDSAFFSVFPVDAELETLGIFTMMWNHKE